MSDANTKSMSENEENETISIIHSLINFFILEMVSFSTFKK